MSQVFGIVLLTLIAGAIARRIIKRLATRAHDTENLLDDVILEAMMGPTRVLIWVLGITFAANIVGAETDEAIFDAVPMLGKVGVILVLMWFGLRFSSGYEQRYIEVRKKRGKEVDITLVHAAGKLLRGAIFVTTALIILQTMGINIAGLLAFGGVGGIAVSLAARDILANVFGGLGVYTERPFAVGDWIRSPDREIEGTVEEIGWRRTAIRTFDKRVLYVPNSVFTTISVENPSRMTHRRIRENIGVRYDDISRVPVILQEVRKYLIENPDIDESQTLMVNLNEFGDSSVNFFIYTFTHTTVWTEFHEIKEKVLLAISDIVEKHGAEIAFPTRTIHVPDGIQVTESTPAQNA
ncbi:MAG: mechanosensitive ion channel family protein [Betaproteobacteria bacterium]|nr:MAG: mechanosensitive ion channel family protein [Betaproteobacteria bacterium]